MNRVVGRHVVVLVDDEPRILSALKRSLKEEPYHVLATVDPRQALRWVGTRDVSALVTDQRMPGMMGTELVDRVRNCSPGTDCVILTAFPLDTALCPASLQGTYDVMQKPWDDARLRRTLREVLSERELEDVSDAVPDRMR